MTKHRVVMVTMMKYLSLRHQNRTSKHKISSYEPSDLTNSFEVSEAEDDNSSASEEFYNTLVKQIRK